jgi:hypothetical protein
MSAATIEYTQSVEDRTVQCATCGADMVLNFDLDNDDREPGNWWHNTCPAPADVAEEPTDAQVMAFMEAALRGLALLG